MTTIKCLRDDIAAVKRSAMDCIFSEVSSMRESLSNIAEAMEVLDNPGLDYKRIDLSLALTSFENELAQCGK